MKYFGFAALYVMTACSSVESAQPAASTRTLPGTWTAPNQLLASLPNSSWLNTGGDGKSVRFIDLDDGTISDVGVNGSDIKLRGVTVADGQNTYRLQINTDLTDPITLQNGAFIDVPFENGDLQVRGLNVGETQAVVAGIWQFDPSVGANKNTFVGGFYGGSFTDISQVPIGSVTYYGRTIGEYRSNNLSTGLEGRVEIVADFTNRSVSGSISDVFIDVAGPLQINSFLISGDIGNGSNTAQNRITFDGNLEVVADGAPTPLTFSTAASDSSSNHIEGQFFGPNAIELGAAYRVKDQSGERFIIGAIVADLTSPD